MRSASISAFPPGLRIPLYPRHCPSRAIWTRSGCGRARARAGHRPDHRRFRQSAAYLQSGAWDIAGNADRACRAAGTAGQRGLTMDWVGFATTWVKALHVISVIAWIAGMMYLPRLFVYHTAAEKGSIQSETFKIMERRLYRGIITPAMALTWIFGLTMVFTPGIVDWHEGWVWVKAAAVILLSAIHGFYGRQVRNFAADK